MKTKIIYILMAFFACSIIACNEKNNSTDEPGTNPQLKQVKEQLLSSNNGFAFDIFKEIYINETEAENVFISPLSIYLALGMAYNGANGTTEDEFVDVLNLEGLSNQQVNEATKELIAELLTSNNDVLLEVANSIWIKEGFPIKQDFIDINQQYYDATAQVLDFSDPLSVDIINDWIADKTHDKIKDMLNEITYDAVLYLINAIYFKADWKYEFADSSNYEGAFNIGAEGFSQVTYMKQKESFNFLNNDMLKAIQLPYNDSAFYMQVMLPVAGFTVDDVIVAMGENWDDWNNSFVNREVTVELPKFKYSYGPTKAKKINEELQNLGLVRAFTGDADFSDITDKSIAISRVLHKAFIEVNETGSEAAAATIIEFELTSVGGESLTFKADKPFVFTICERETNTILFMGVVGNPVYED